MTWCVRTVAQSVFAPIICHFPTSRPYLSLWLDDGYNNAICHLFCIFSRGVFLFSIYLFLIAILANYSNPINVLKIPRRAIVVCNRPFYWLVSLPLTLLLSVLFVDNLQVCVRQKLYVLLYDCVYNMAIGSVSAPMWLSISLSSFPYIVQVLFYFPFFLPFIFWFL